MLRLIKNFSIFQKLYLFFFQFDSYPIFLIDLALAGGTTISVCKILIMFGNTIFILFSTIKLIFRETEFAVSISFNASLSKSLDKKLIDWEVHHWIFLKSQFRFRI